MSYEIVYDRLAIKIAEDKYIFLLQSGSNNCWEASFRGPICEKTWFTPIRDCADAPYVTAEEFEKHLAFVAKSFVDVDGYLQIFKSRNKPWGLKAYLSWVRTAMKKAETVEEISKRFSIKVFTDLKGEKALCNYTVIRTTDELIQYIENAKKLDGFISIHWELPRKITHIRKNPKNIKKVSCFYVIKDKYDYFFSMRMANRIYLSRNMQQVRKFASEKLAEEYIAKYSLRQSGVDIVTRIDDVAYI